MATKRKKGSEMQAADSFIDLVQEKSADNAELYPTFVACINDYNQGRYEHGSTSIHLFSPPARAHTRGVHANGARTSPRAAFTQSTPLQLVQLDNGPGPGQDENGVRGTAGLAAQVPGLFVERAKASGRRPQWSRFQQQRSVQT
jgi:hypothetical protein